MDRNEKVHELIERATRLGLRLEFDSGPVLVKRTESGDPERQRETITELGKYLRDIRQLVKRHATGARARVFVGQQIWSEEGEGVLADTSTDGELTISIARAESRRPQTVTSNAKSLLIVLDQEKEDGATSSDREQTSEPPRKRLCGVF